MKKVLNTIFLFIFTTASLVTLVSCESKTQKELESLKEQLKDQEKQEKQKEESILLGRARKSGRTMGGKDFEDSYFYFVRMFDTKETITPQLQNDKPKRRENSEMTFRDVNKYEFDSNMLEKLVKEWRLGYDEGWNDSYNYYMNRNTW